MPYQDVKRANMKGVSRFFPLTEEIDDPFSEEDWKISMESLERMFESDVIEFEWGHS